MRRLLATTAAVQIQDDREAGSPNALPAIDVRIEANAGWATEYAADRGGAMRLARLHAPGESALPGDVGTAVDARDTAGDPLHAIILSRASLHPGAIVPTRVIGVAHPDGRDEPWLVGIPLAGEDRAAGEDPADLLARIEDRLRRFLGADTLAWKTGSEAASFARQAVLRGRRLAADERAQRQAVEAAWEPTPGARRRWTTFEGETHTAAEHDVRRLPIRFHAYAREVLLPQERLLVAVHRPALALGRWSPGRRRLHEAVLLLSTQQLVELSDARPPDLDAPLGGFIARATAVERIAAARVERGAETATLVLELQGSSGSACWRVVGPLDRRMDELAERATIFTPRVGELRPARRAFSAPQDVDTTSWQAFFSSDARSVWQQRLAALAAGDETLLTWALAPAMPADGSRDATAVALTSTRVMACGQRGDVRAWQIGAVTSVEVRSSPFASALRLWTTGTEPAFQLPFPFTLSPAWIELFLAVRQRLAAYPLS